MGYVYYLTGQIGKFTNKNGLRLFIISNLSNGKFSYKKWVNSGYVLSQTCQAGKIKTLAKLETGQMG